MCYDLFILNPFLIQQNIYLNTFTVISCQSGLRIPAMKSNAPNNKNIKNNNLRDILMFDVGRKSLTIISQLCNLVVILCTNFKTLRQ